MISLEKFRSLLNIQTAPLLIFCLVFGLTCLIGLPSSSRASKQSRFVGNVIPISEEAASIIEYGTVESKYVPLKISCTGKIEAIPAREFDQHSPVAGRVNTVKISLGDQVKEGQTLLLLNSEQLTKLSGEILQKELEIESKIEQRSSAFDARIAHLTELVDLDKKNYARSKKLFEEKIASKAQFQKSEADLDINQNKLEAEKNKRKQVLESLRKQLELTLAPLKQQLELLGESEEKIEKILSSKKPVAEVSVKSARSGVVTFLDVSPGESISTEKKLCTVSDLKTVWATAHVFEEDINNIQLDQKVEVRLRSVEDQVFKGVLTFVGSKVEEDSRTVDVRAELKNPDGLLKPEMYADLIIQTNNPQRKLYIPAGSVVSKKGHDLVFLKVEDGVRAIAIVTGKEYDNQTEVLKGLTAGQQIVTKGMVHLAHELDRKDSKNPKQASQEKTRDSSKEPIWIVAFVSVLVGICLGAGVVWMITKARSS